VDDTPLRANSLDGPNERTRRRGLRLAVESQFLTVLDDNRRFIVNAVFFPNLLKVLGRGTVGPVVDLLNARQKEN